MIDKTDIKQGDIFWIQESSDSDIPHPYVVIQDTALNQSRIATVVVCALTSNLKRVAIPGNVLLDAGEGDLPKQSVVEVSKVSTVHKAQLGEYVGTLSDKRIKQILSGIRFVQSSFFDQH